jgi:hypothetical protein
MYKSQEALLVNWLMLDVPTTTNVLVQKKTGNHRM